MTLKEILQIPAEEINCCEVEIDASGREIANHGSYDFPVAIYRDTLEIMDVDWHWHEELELIVVLDGEGLFTVNDKRYVLKAGQGLFINGEVLHGAWCTESKHCDICSLVFHPRFIAGGKETRLWQSYVAPLLQNKGMAAFAISDKKGLENQLLRDILKAWVAGFERPEGYEFEVRESLSKVILSLYKQMDEQNQAISSKTIRNNERMKLMLQFLQRNYIEDIRVEDIANSASISESECLRCFKEMLGMPPSQYLKEYRLQKACELLQGTKLTVRQISEQCGFSDESYFVKLFREKKHMTPAVYRKEYQG